MREILFRAQRVVDKEWVEGFLLQGINKDVMLIQYWSNEKCYCLEDIIPETVGQFTGLTDKNGIKIFEGDIVQRGVITFSRGKFQGTYYDGSGDLAEDWEDDLYQERNIEVLGNIYENPELLQDDF